MFHALFAINVWFVLRHFLCDDIVYFQEDVQGRGRKELCLQGSAASDGMYRPAVYQHCMPCAGV
jgi:hypothetical protein